MFTGHNVVKVFGRQQAAIDTFDEQNEKLYQASFKAQFISGIIMPVMNFVRNLNYVAIAVIGGVMVASGRMSLGDVQAFIQYSRQFTMPITQVASIMNVLQSTAASAERVFELLDEAEETPDPAELRASVEHTHGHIELRRRLVPLRARHAAHHRTHARRRSPARPSPSSGPTGAGKTTLVNLLLRFYDVDARRHQRRRRRHPAHRRAATCAACSAWCCRTPGCSAAPSARTSPTAARARPKRRSVRPPRAARVDHFVRALPDGYDTVLDDDATNVSQGERQLLTIARAFLADPDILILDEATSSVDTRTEVLIQQAMAELMKDRTSFVIAHRLSTIRDADIILVMDKGAIIEQGSHEELHGRPRLLLRPLRQPVRGGAGRGVLSRPRTSAPSRRVRRSRRRDERVAARLSESRCEATRAACRTSGADPACPAARSTP